MEADSWLLGPTGLFCLEASRQSTAADFGRLDDGWPGLIVLLFADPHLLEGGQRGQDGATNPDRVFALGRGDDLLVRMRKGR